MCVFIFILILSLLDIPFVSCKIHCYKKTPPLIFIIHSRMKNQWKILLNHQLSSIVYFNHAYFIISIYYNFLYASLVFFFFPSRTGNAKLPRARRFSAGPCPCVRLSLWAHCVQAESSFSCFGNEISLVEF